MSRWAGSFSSDKQADVIVIDVRGAGRIGTVMYAVTGITGKVGAAVARTLLAADQPVRAVVRDQSRSAPWAQLGCDIAVADLSDTEALTAAFAGTATKICATWSWRGSIRRSFCAS